MAGTKAASRKSLKTSGKKDSQKMIPGTEPERIKAIEDVAKKYVNCRDERMGLTEEEIDLKAKLIDVMKSHNCETYQFDGYMCELSHVDEDQVKVKKARAAKEDASLA